jgi:hypothetical protein
LKLGLFGCMCPVLVSVSITPQPRLQLLEELQAT